MCPYVCLNVFQLFELSDEARSTSFIFSFKHNKQHKNWKPGVYRLVIYGISTSCLSIRFCIVTSSTCPPQVMIPSVKLDFSHIQSKCGSLDKVHHTAGGGNVSNSAESSSQNSFVSMLCHSSCRVC